MSRKSIDGFFVARIIAVAMLLIALSSNPYSYYTLLRWVVCATCAYGVYASRNSTGWAFSFALAALLFNPAVPVRLDRDLWSLVDLGAAAFLLVSLRTPRPRKRARRRRAHA